MKRAKGRDPAAGLVRVVYERGAFGDYSAETQVRVGPVWIVCNGSSCAERGEAVKHERYNAARIRERIRQAVARSRKRRAK